MAQSILIIADSGTGKSTAIRHLNPDETFIINVANKPLPFKGWKGMYTPITKDNPKGNLASSSSTPGVIKAILHVNEKMPHIKTLVVDDWQYMSSFEYFDRANEKGYEKFTQIAANLAQVAKLPKDLRDDLTVFYFSHPDTIEDSGEIIGYKMKTSGKLIDSQINLEGLFTVVLYTNVEENKDGTVNYEFVTNRYKKIPAKSPDGMFAETKIPNNLQLVVETLNEYYN